MSNAEAWITGEYPNQKLNLKLPTGATGPQGPVGPIGPASTVPGPATELTVLDTVTGPETPGATGPQGVKGDKGDPGGWIGGAALGTSDLNLITTPGLYKQDNSGNSTFVRNYPREAVGGAMKVYDRVAPGVSASVFQEFTPAVNSVAGAPFFYIRYSYNNHASWSPWRTYTSARVDQTAGRAIYQWDDLNNREQLIYGDTGWRDISASLINGWTGQVKIRRIGYTVYITYGSLTEATATAKEIYLLPSGFGNNDWIRWMVRTSTQGIQDMMLTNTHLSLYGSPSPTGATISNGTYSAVTYCTTQAWPTTLPGVAAYGSIPNV